MRPPCHEQSLYHRRGILLIGVADVVRVEVRLAVDAVPVEVHGVLPRSLAGTKCAFCHANHQTQTHPSLVFYARPVCLKQKARSARYAACTLQ